MTKHGLFTDDLLLPYETRIYFSKTKALIWLIASAIMLSALIYLAFTDSKSYLAVVICGTVFSFVLVNCVKHLIEKKPQVIINKNGLKVGKLPFYEWKDINKEEIITEIKRGPTYFLKYDSPSGIRKFYTGLWTVDHRMLAKMLIIYRGRSNVENLI